MTYLEARAKAQAQSKEHHASQHVNAVIGKDWHDDEPRIIRYTVNDWMDGTTVSSFFNGEEVS